MQRFVPILLAACSFEHGRLPGGSGSGSGFDPPDAQAVVHDASIDAPPDACLDDDADGICNASDNWPCGVEPSSPPSVVSFSDNSGNSDISLSFIDLDNDGQETVATPGEDLSLSFGYGISDTACPGDCRDQLEVGWVPGGRLGCAFDQTVDKQDGAFGAVSVSIEAPATKGVYDLRVNLGQNYSCYYNGADSWWNSTPAASHTIAKLCVH